MNLLLEFELRLYTWGYLQTIHLFVYDWLIAHTIAVKNQYNWKSMIYYNWMKYELN